MNCQNYLRGISLLPYKLAIIRDKEMNMFIKLLSLPTSYVCIARIVNLDSISYTSPCIHIISIFIPFLLIGSYLYYTYIIIYHKGIGIIMVFIHMYTFCNPKNPQTFCISFFLNYIYSLCTHNVHSYICIIVHSYICIIVHSYICIIVHSQ